MRDLYHYICNNFFAWGILLPTLVCRAGDTNFKKGVGMWATSQPFYRSYSFFGSLENTKIQVLALLRLWPSKDCTESCFIKSKFKKGQVVCQEPILTVKYGWTFLEDFECHPCWNALNGVSKTLSEIASLRLFLRS